MTTFTTSDRRSHTLSGTHFDGVAITEIVHPPMVGESAEFFLTGGRWALTATITTINFK
jgi:hypothetical protein